MLVTDLLRRNRLLQPDTTAVWFGGDTTTYEELDERVNRTANAIAALGVGKGDRVAILSRNCPEYLDVYFADGKIGAVTTPLNFRLAPAELEYIINDSEAVVLIAAAEYIDAVESIRSNLRNVREFLCIGAAPDGWKDFRALTAAAPAAAPDVDVHEDDLLYQMYTSGTTGRPKGAMISHRNVCTNITQLMLANRTSEGDRGLIVAPMYHAAAGICSLCFVAGGATIVMMEDFVPDEVLRVLAEQKVTHALLVPAMILFLLGMPEVEKTDFSALRCIMYGASPIPAEVLKKAIEVFGCDFVQAFGQTESVAVLSVLSAADHKAAVEQGKAKLLTSCGREAFGTEVRIVDEEGKEVADGELGEIVARGGQVMRGYWKLEEATASTLKDGWLHTGDIGMRDGDGYLYVMDRMKDMIVSGGENVYPREIEEVLFSHPDIADAAVIGVPSDKWGESVKAVVVPKPGAGLDERAVISFCGERLAGYKRPNSVDFIDALPKNPSGKVLKRELREPYWKDKGRRVN